MINFKPIVIDGKTGYIAHVSKGYQAFIDGRLFGPIKQTESEVVQSGISSDAHAARLKGARV